MQLDVFSLENVSRNRNTLIRIHNWRIRIGSVTVLTISVINEIDRNRVKQNETKSLEKFKLYFAVYIFYYLFIYFVKIILFMAVQDLNETSQQYDSFSLNCRQKTKL
jgi:hypothetical protein